MRSRSRTEAKPKKKRTRGPSKGLTLDSYVGKIDCHKILIDKKYRRPDWSSDALYNITSVWFDIHSFLLYTWCHEVETTRYKTWKNRLHIFWSACGDTREATPKSSSMWSTSGSGYAPISVTQTIWREVQPT